MSQMRTSEHDPSLVLEITILIPAIIKLVPTAFGEACHFLRMFGIFKRFITSAEKSAKIQLKLLKDPLESIKTRPLAPYTVFVKENFARVSEELNNKQSTKIMAELGRKWKETADKEIYKEKADKINQETKSKFDQILSSLTVADFRILQRRRALGKLLGKSLPKLRDPSKPKRLTAHALYLAKNYQQFKDSENPMQAALQEFKKLSKDEVEV